MLASLGELPAVDFPGVVLRQRAARQPALRPARVARRAVAGGAGRGGRPSGDGLVEVLVPRPPDLAAAGVRPGRGRLPPGRRGPGAAAAGAPRPGCARPSACSRRAGSWSSTTPAPPPVLAASALAGRGCAPTAGTNRAARPSRRSAARTSPAWWRSTSWPRSAGRRCDASPRRSGCGRPRDRRSGRGGPGGLAGAGRARRPRGAEGPQPGAARPTPSPTRTASAPSGSSNGPCGEGLPALDRRPVAPAGLGSDRRDTVHDDLTRGVAVRRCRQSEEGHQPGARPSRRYYLESRTFPPVAGVRGRRPRHATTGSTTRPTRTGRRSGAARPRELLDWYGPWDTICEWELPFAKWFIGGQLNVSYNCLDRHVAAGRGDRVAYHWEGEPGDTRTITYAELLAEVLEVRQRPQVPRRGPGRPGGHLHADDPRAARRHAGLHPHRGGPLGRLRRLLVRRPPGPHRRRRGQGPGHRRRRLAAGDGRPCSSRRPTWRWPTPPPITDVVVVRRTGSPTWP